jgi:hypothetical protein
MRHFAAFVKVAGLPPLGSNQKAYKRDVLTFVRCSAVHVRFRGQGRQLIEGGQGESNVCV